MVLSAPDLKELDIGGIFFFSSLASPLLATARRAWTISSIGPPAFVFVQWLRQKLLFPCFEQNKQLSQAPLSRCTDCFPVVYLPVSSSRRRAR